MLKCEKLSRIPILTQYVKLPLIQLLGRKFPKYYKELKKTQYLPLEKLKEIQFLKFKAILEIAYNHVEFYRELYDNANIKPSDIKSLDDISKLPIITKRNLKEAYPEKTINEKINKKQILINSTSGSTGKPFEFALNWEKKDRIEALKMRNFEYVNYGYGRKFFSLWGFSPNLSFVSKLYQKFILKRILLSSLNLTEDVKEKYSMILMENPYSFLDGYSSGLIYLAKYMISKNYKANLCGVLSTAETLIPEHRKLLEKAYGCKVFNRYGTREFGDIAIECVEHKGLHVNMESFIVEIVDKNGYPCNPGEEGRIIITDLDNKVMPFIRYDTEDSASYISDRCSCGRSSILLGQPSGRIVDTIVTPEGKHLSFGFFVLKFEEYPIVDQFQVVQIDKNNIKLKIVKNPSFTEKEFKPLLDCIIDYCKPMNVHVKYVKEIPPEPSGKMRIVKGLS